MAPLLVEFSAIPATGKVLDVGTGTGSLTFAVATAKRQCDVVGVDLSEDYITYARSRNASGTRVSFEVGNAELLRFPEATFNCSASLLAFNFVPHPHVALREMVRVTKPGGWITAAVWDYGAGMRMLRVFWDAAVVMDPGARIRDERLMMLSGAGELSQLWIAGGLEDVTERVLNITMRFESFSDYWEPFLLGQGPAGVYIQTLKHDQVAALRKEVKNRLGISTENFPFELPSSARAVRGRAPIRDSTARA